MGKNPRTLLSTSSPLLHALFLASLVSAIGLLDSAIPHSAPPIFSELSDQAGSPRRAPVSRSDSVMGNLTRPTITSVSPPSPLRTADSHEPLCFPPASFSAELDLLTCVDALRKYQEDPHFDDPITFCTDAGGDACGRQVPLFYGTPGCVVILGAVVGPHDDRFSLKSTWGTAERLLLDCLVIPRPGFRYGGVVPIGNDRGFFMSIAGRPWVPGNETSDTLAGQDEGGGGVEAVYQTFIKDFARWVAGPVGT